MNIFDTVITIDKDYYIQSHYPISKTLLFDIETTGFSPDYTTCYLIGLMYFDDNTNQWILRQYFNDDGESELQIIKEFMEFSLSYQYLFNFNGDGFDIPYLFKKIAEYHLEWNFHHLESVDLYKAIKPYKKSLYLDSLKQKSIEQFLCIDREDKYSGGDLIEVYKTYLKNHNPDLLKFLLQHNFEDVEGLFLISEILCYRDLFSGCFIATSANIIDQRLIINLLLDYPIPKRISKGNNQMILTGINNDVTLNIPIIFDELKFYFKDTSNYYYLPSEDKAIHKSVATYVDKEYRVKAKKSNCYVKKNGAYVREYNGENFICYKKDYQSKESYIDVEESLLSDLTQVTKYARHIIKYI